MTENITTFENKANILGEFWLNYKIEEDFADFMEYNDLGLPIAYAIDHKIVEPSPRAELFINETWELFLKSLEIADNGFENLGDVFDAAGIDE